MAAKKRKKTPNGADGELPYEKFLRLGPESLTESELLAIIIRSGTKEKSSIEIGREVMRLSKERDGAGLNALHHLTLRELQSIPGVGEVNAVKIKCLTEFSKRMAREEAGDKLQFSNPYTVAEYYMEQMRHQETEKVLLLLLDNKMRLSEEHVLSIGTVNASLLSPREVFLHALKAEAVYLMLLHNHPSGDPTPSRNDIELTKRIGDIGRMIDITLIDHIVIGDNRYMSFKEAGLLEKGVSKLE